MGVNKARRAIVQKLNHIARQCGVPAVSNTAGQKIVDAMYRAIAAKLPSGFALTTAATAAFDEYTASFPKVAVQPGQAHVAKEWHFKAAQFTYNATVGEWVSKDHATLEALFTRLVLPIFDLVGAHPWLQRDIGRVLADGRPCTCACVPSSGQGLPPEGAHCIGPIRLTRDQAAHRSQQGQRWRLDRCSGAWTFLCLR